MATSHSEASAPAVLKALSEISRALTETLEPRAVFARIAEASRGALAFDAMGVNRVEGGGWIHVYAVAGGEKAEEAGLRFHKGEISPRLRTQGERILRIDDARTSLDPSFTLDRRLLDRGTRSLLFGPIRAAGSVLGTLWFAATRPGAFHDADEPAVEAIADLVAVALEHERLSAAARERQARLRSLEALSPALARALDVRDVFDQVAQIARNVVPHDRMTLTLLSDDFTQMTVHAYSGEPLPGAPETLAVSPGEREQLEREYQIVGDLETGLDPSSPRRKALLDAGLRSFLRVPIHLEGKVAGGLGFHSAERDRYRIEDVELAQRIADQVALALSHQRLAEEARRTEEAREQAARLEARVRRLRDELESRDGFGRAVGGSPAWVRVLVQASKVAPTETTVLLTGESGTGKELIARAIHRASPRAEQPFIALNCAALPEQLLESELFGYEKGAFTGAVSPHPGRLEQAAGGLLFLDEAGEMSPLVQAKLLRVLQEREFQRLGGTRVLKADVRVVAATNRNLRSAIGRGEFREDLFYRLGVFEIHLPPLRERKEDLLPLTARFLEEIGKAIGRPTPGISRQARERILSYSWPGNVRELRNALERALILAEGGLIQAEHLPISVSAPAPQTGPAGLGTLPPEGLRLEDLERTLVEQALERTRYNKTRAARLLGLTRAQLYSRMEKYSLGGR